MQQTCRVITNVYQPGTEFREHMGIRTKRIPLNRIHKEREKLLKVSLYSLTGEVVCTVGETTIEMADELSGLWQQVLNALEDLCEMPMAKQGFPDCDVEMYFQIPEKEPNKILFWLDLDRQNRINCDRKLFLSALLDGAETFFQTVQDAMAGVDLTQYPLCGEPRDPKEYQFDNIMEWIAQLRGQLLQS